MKQSRSTRSFSPRSSSRRTPKPLNYLIFLNREATSYFKASNGKVLNQIETSLKDRVRAEFDPQLFIPEVEGTVLSLVSESRSSKLEFLSALIDHFVYLNRNKSKDAIQFTILVPNGLISYLIGLKGRQIIELNRESGAGIIIHQPIHKMLHRVISISGPQNRVFNALKLMFSILEERYLDAKQLEMAVKPIDLSSTLTSAKIQIPVKVFANPDDRANYAYNLRKTYDLTFNVYIDKKAKTNVPFSVAYFKGKIESVQEAVCNLISKSRDLLIEKGDCMVIYMLVDKFCVSKLVGKDKCMLMAIMSQSGGSDIQLVTEGRVDPESQEVALRISGSQRSVESAIKLILEQTECFRTGGPVFL